MTVEDDRGDGFDGLEVFAKALQVGSPWALAGVLLEQTPPVRRRQAGRLVEDIVRLIGRDFDQFLVRVRADRRLMWTLAELVEAASRTAPSNEEKIRALARVAVSAWTDDAAIDGAPIETRTISALEAPHIRLLVALARQGENGFVVQVGILRTLIDVEPPILHALLEDLKRLALVIEQTNPGITPGVTYHVSDYGKRILERMT